MDKKARKFLGSGVAKQLLVPTPKEGEIVLFVSDGEVGAHESLLAGASEMAIQMTVQQLMTRIKEPPPLSKE